MNVVPNQAPVARRWLAHLVGVSESGHSPIDAADRLPSFDTDSVLELARRERIAPLLHVGFASGRIAERVPESFRSACEADYYRSLRANIVALKSGARILNALRGDGIAAAPINGWSIIGGPLEFHSDPGARSVERLEIMVRESQWRAAETVLQNLGYGPQETRQVRRDSSCGRCYTQKDSGQGPRVELHWSWEGSSNLGRRDVVSGDRFLDGLCDTTRSGYHQPTRFSLLASAAFRAARRDPGRWMRLDDIHRLVSALPMDWVGLVTEARQWRVSAPVYAGLVATRELFGTAIPRGVLERLAPGPMRRHLLHRNLAAQWRGCEAADAAQVPHLLFAENWWELARSLGGVRIPAAIRSSMARRVSDRRRSLIRSLRFLQGD